jgi:hypothetical protein
MGSGCFPYVIDSLPSMIWYFICHCYGPESRATMYKMTKRRRVPSCHAALGMLCLVLGLSPGCAHSEHRTEANSSASEQELPFHPDTDRAPASDGTHPAVSPDPKLAGSLPFRAVSHPRVLPSGTLLTVQLEDSLSANHVRAGDAFAASVAAPLTIDGDTLIEQGAEVTGRVESAQSQADRPGLVPGSGYFRLTLIAITVEGKQLALQTSSLFARGTFQESKASSSTSPTDLSDGVRVQKGRRLTFRLTAPVPLDGPNSMANRQYLGPRTE